MPVPWSRYEDQWFIDHILPTAGKGTRPPHFEPLATEMQKVMNIIYPDSGKRRKYTALMLYQYYYRKYAPHVKRRQENVKKFPPTTADQLGMFGLPHATIQEYRKTHKISYGPGYHKPVELPLHNGQRALAARTKHQDFMEENRMDNEVEDGGVSRFDNWLFELSGDFSRFS